MGCPRGGSIPDVIEGEGANELKVECGVLGLDACELGLVANPPLRRRLCWWNVGVEWRESCRDGGFRLEADTASFGEYLDAAEYSTEIAVGPDDPRPCPGVL